MPAERDIRRNQLLLVIDAVGWPLGQSFLAPQTIVAMFVARLAGSQLPVGLMVGLQSFGQLMPQLLVSNRIEGLPRTRAYVVTVGVLVERLPILVLVAAALLVDDGAVLLAIFFVCWAVMSLGTGINLPAFMSLFSKAVPADRRGRVTGIGNSAGTLLAAGGALLARVLLSGARGLSGYAWCFLIGFGVLLASVLPLALVDEPREEQAERRRLLAYLKEIPALVRRGSAFSWYLLMQISLQLAVAGISFVTGFAVLGLGLDEATIATGSAVLMAATAGSSALYGLAADRAGYRTVFRFGALAAVMGYGLLAAAPALLTVFTAYALAGCLMGAVLIGGNMTMEFAAPRRTATYTAIVFTAVAPVRAGGPLVFGLLADMAGSRALFALCAASAAAALAVALFRLSDPRRESPGRDR